MSRQRFKPARAQERSAEASARTSVCRHAAQTRARADEERSIVEERHRRRGVRLLDPDERITEMAANELPEHRDASRCRNRAGRRPRRFRHPVRGRPRAQWGSARPRCSRRCTTQRREGQSARIAIAAWLASRGPEFQRPTGPAPSMGAVTVPRCLRPDLEAAGILDRRVACEEVVAGERRRVVSRCAM